MSKTYAELPEAQMQRFVDRVRRVPEEARPGILSDVGEAIIGEAQVEAPVLTGFLSDSHTVVEIEDEAVVIGVNADYAMAVHETHPTKAHWFINAINRNFARAGRKAIIKALRERGAST